jgi:hypothetical protein
VTLHPVDRLHLNAAEMSAFFWLASCSGLTQSMVAVRLGANGAVCLTAASPVPQIAHQLQVAWYRAPQVTKIGPVEL